MDDLTMWSLIVGALAPPAIATIQQPRWSSRTRAITTVLLCALIGAVTAALNGDLTGRSWASSALVVGVSALTTYRGLWVPTGVAPTVEAATSKAHTTPH